MAFRGMTNVIHCHLSSDWTVAFAICSRKAAPEELWMIQLDQNVDAWIIIGIPMNE